MGKFLKAFASALVFAAAFWLWAALPPLRAQGFGSIQNSSSAGTSAASHSVLAIVGPAMFFGATCTGQIGATTTPAGYCIVIDSATIPSDGAITTPKACVAMGASTAATAAGATTASITAGAGSLPVPFQNGIVAFLSTGANCLTKTTNDGFTEMVSVNFN